MPSNLPPHRTSGDMSLRFIHERDWLTGAIVGDKEGATKLEEILKSGVMPGGRVIDRWSQSPMSDLNSINIYLREET